MTNATPHVLDFAEVRRGDVARVGGKNASLGEMIGALVPKGIAVPPGFATTAEAFREYLAFNELNAAIAEELDALAAGRIALSVAGERIRAMILSGDWPAGIAEAIRTHYRALGHGVGQWDVPIAAPVAVRSSATAEDLPDASFAGQQETFLNVTGDEALLDACKRCYASLYTDRAIAYRQMKGFAHDQVALSVGVQRMVRADTGGSGVMFSIDTESGFPNAVLINAAWGLGENVVQGAVDPDEYQVFKPFLNDPERAPILEKAMGAKAIKMVHGPDGVPRNVPTSKAERARFVLSDAEIVDLARQAVVIEDHYGCPMDMEWARDGETGKIYIVQARPETVQSRADAGKLRSYAVSEAGRVLTAGLSVGSAAVTGRVSIIEDAADIDRFVDGSVLVTSTTNPDWVPIMKRAAAIVTDHGGRTSHAAIVSRELGLPAIVGCGDATRVLHDEQEVTVSCAGGERGEVTEGAARIAVTEEALGDLPRPATQVMLNLANPGAAFRWWRLPVDGVGLARMEFVVNNTVKVHPMALIHPERVTDPEARARIDTLTADYASPPDYFVERLAQGLSRIAAFCHPKPVIVRMSDFKTNEYADLLGGRDFEPSEENPMIGLRGASRYDSDLYREGFALECRAIARLRGVMGFENVIVMIPFCRTPEEADRVLAVMAEHGLERGRDGLQVYVMAEIPTNVIRAAEFAQRFDGFSIGSNDLTQLTLGIDRDSDALAASFREDDPSVLWMIERLIGEAHAAGVKVGFCGQAPSNDPSYARRLVGFGIDSISVTPDSFAQVLRNVSEAENEA
ncbi:phosphoenolpyruvate synthase [Jannaschia seohaensis]|uniref:Phosphoenolpyruvate synthase n=1 Tax=Jannaschia seohaensis TaxID=475081 RepID=A0A2Y9C5L6_9RHOB|nr:phosphoenolpyruvate synthase [Jannaschia seohaensis]PWJ21123.1 pyruvate,water dikinase [Jannaschia seohaensis]SSA41533.1 pyruvate, water dikinase [Jannaschia seohaensis]